MNIFDIGVDIIEIDRIRKAVDKNNRFLEKIFTDREIEYFNSKNFK
ncbi:4'-phosphopantetheinyl transferase superfamily protein, partial [Clostridioides difficile]